MHHDMTKASPAPSPLKVRVTVPELLKLYSDLLQENRAHLALIEELQEALEDIALMKPDPTVRPPELDLAHMIHAAQVVAGKALAKSRAALEGK